MFFFLLFLSLNCYEFLREAVALWIRCLPRNLGIVGLNPTQVTTMIPHIAPALFGSILYIV